MQLNNKHRNHYSLYLCRADYVGCIKNTEIPFVYCVNLCGGSIPLLATKLNWLPTTEKHGAEKLQNYNNNIVIYFSPQSSPTLSRW